MNAESAFSPNCRPFGRLGDNTERAGRLGILIALTHI